MQLLSPDQIFLAAELLKKGEVVAFPTETVYGLGACVFDEAAVQKIFQMKGRPSNNPLICHIATFEALALLAREIPETVLKLAAHFWPGPLTLILKKHPNVPLGVTGGHDTVAIRMPRHPIALKLIGLAGEPLVAPSANKSGRPSSTTAEHVLSDFEGQEGAVIDGGATTLGVESTVLYLAGEKPLILRPGSITREELSAVLQCEVGNGDGSHASPGTKYKHYAPKAKIEIVGSFEAASREAFLMSLEERPGFHHLTAATLYALLRQADLEGAEKIVVVCREWSDEALKDRLLRAAAHG